MVSLKSNFQLCFKYALSVYLVALGSYAVRTINQTNKKCILYLCIYMMARFKYNI